MELTQERLKEVLHYEQETGVFTWKIKTNWSIMVGSVAGSIHKSGYIAISLDKKQYLAHRLAFLYVEGVFPKRGMFVDHINHSRVDNRWENLRVVTRQDNARNTSMGKNNKSGVVGVFWCKHKNKWQAQICSNGKIKHLGFFDVKNDAINVRKDAEKKYGYHPNHGK